MRGVIAPESANNAKEGGVLIPTIAFGVPGGAAMALLLGAFPIQGLIPGPDMLTRHLDVTYTIVWSIAVANILGTSICLLFTNQIAKIATIRANLLWRLSSSWWWCWPRSRPRATSATSWSSRASPSSAG